MSRPPMYPVLALALALAAALTALGLASSSSGEPVRFMPRHAHQAGEGADAPRADAADQALRVRCRRAAYRRAHPATCPSVASLLPARPLPAASTGAALAAVRRGGAWAAPERTPSLGTHGILLPTGKVMFIALPEERQIATNNRTQVHIWDPRTNRTRRIAAPGGGATDANVWCAGHAFLPDGRLLVAGGNLDFYRGAGPGQGFKGLDRLFTFNPWNETWTEQPRMRHGRWYPSVVTLPDGRAVIMSGLDEEGDGRINEDVEVFTPSPDPNGVGSLALQESARRGTVFYPHLFLVPGGKVLLAGPGRDDSALLDPATWTWTELPRLPESREWGGAVLMPAPAGGPRAVMLLGGSATSERPSTTNTTLVLDLATPEAGWRPGPSLAHARSHLNTLILPDGTLATFGGGVGNRGGSNYAGAIFRPELLAPGGRWRAAANAAEERTYHAVALLLPDGRVLTAGDDRLSHQARARRTQEVYSPPYLFRGARPRIASAPGSVGYGETFRVASRDAARVRRAVLLSPSAVTHATDMGGRSIELAFTPGGGGALSLTAPAEPSLAPPGYHMLFLVDGRGRPSHARWIRLTSGT